MSPSAHPPSPSSVQKDPSATSTASPPSTTDLVQEILPLPAMTDPEHKEVAGHLDQVPTASHDLAVRGGEDEGDEGMVDVVQKRRMGEEGEYGGGDGNDVGGGGGVVDLGWQRDVKNAMPGDNHKSLVGGVEDEDLWVLVRRFNQVSTVLVGWLSPCLWRLCGMP